MELYNKFRRQIPGRVEIVPLSPDGGSNIYLPEKCVWECDAAILTVPYLKVHLAISFNEIFHKQPSCPEKINTEHKN